ncbi:MAG: hypothetical protein KAS04_03590 [Candidatus Aenigmarchaeota archaeon]|nr:hypothetical protein [Candidatus Aenigmarchaeota archaeon]
MSFIGDFIGDITGANQAADAAKAAAETQAGAAKAGIAEQRRQFDAITQMMTPFLEAGTGALSAQQELAGLAGPEAQQAAIQQLQTSPAFQAMTQQGEEAILQRASATGGLRGGNVQGALAQFRPQMLSQMIESQYGKLGGLTSMGQATAARQAAAGQATSSNIANLLQQQAAATAGGQIAAGQSGQQAFGNILGLGAVASGFF